jgi:hypothetical protein
MFAISWRFSRPGIKGECAHEENEETLLGVSTGGSYADAGKRSLRPLFAALCHAFMALSSPRSSEGQDRVLLDVSQGLHHSIGEVALMDTCSMALPDAPFMLFMMDEDDGTTCSLCSPAKGAGRSTDWCWWQMVLISDWLLTFLAHTGLKRMSWRRRQ